MSALSPGYDDALKQSSVLQFTAVEILLPDYALRLIDGAGYVDFGGRHFDGIDPTYGTLHSIDPFEDASDGQAPSLKISLLPPTMTAAAALASISAQGSTVTIWDGAVDPMSGIVIDDPDPWFIGELDVPVLRVAKGGGRLLEYEATSVWERFFADDEGARLTNAFHQYLWPGELGLEFHTEVQQQLPWGSDGPRPAVIRDVPQYAGGWGVIGGRPDFR